MSRRKSCVLFLLGLLIIGLSLYSRPEKNPSLVGIYWGAFDPPTIAHEAIMMAAFNDIPLQKLLVVVNNHSYKNYTFPLMLRILSIKQMVLSKGIKNVEVLWQDDHHQLDYKSLKEIAQAPLCVIAGYDSYQSWTKHSQPAERAIYDAIAVIPRGNEKPLLVDQKAFLLPIDASYKDVSSTKIRESLKRT